jgi:carbon storage regulator CsrA
MLVLSRRVEEKIILPSVPAILEVVAVQNNLVRLGIDAPRTVPILRAELLREPERSTCDPAAAAPAAPSRNHVVRNRVNNLLLGLTLLRVRMQGDAETLQLLEGMEEEVRSLQRAVAPGRPETRIDRNLFPDPEVA